MKRLAYLLVLLIPLFSCTQNSNNEAEMGAAKEKEQAAKNEQRVRDFYQKVINEHNPTMIDSFCHANFVDHNPFPGQPQTLEGLKKGFNDYLAAFPDMYCRVDMIKAWGDTCMVKFHMTGTNTGMFMGAPATGKMIDIEGADILVIKDGMATEHWGYMEESKMMNQLGMGQQAPETGGNVHGN